MRIEGLHRNRQRRKEEARTLSPERGRASRLRRSGFVGRPSAAGAKRGLAPPEEGAPDSLAQG